MYLVPFSAAQKVQNREAVCCEVALVWKQDFWFPSFLLCTHETAAQAGGGRI